MPNPMRKLNYDRARDQLHALIHKADPDKLARIYLLVFGNIYGTVYDCYASQEEPCLLVQFKFGHDDETLEEVRGI